MGAPAEPGSCQNPGVPGTIDDAPQNHAFRSLVQLPNTNIPHENVENKGSLKVFYELPTISHFLPLKTALVCAKNVIFSGVETAHGQ